MAAESFAFVNSETISGTKALLNAVLSETCRNGIYSRVYSIAEPITIAKDFLLLCPQKARVLQPFTVNVQITENGFVATSNISDVYELGDTFAQSVLNYLYSLVDDLIWFEERKQSLSLPMQKELDKLQFYLSLV
jgi:hypothetical protein